MVLTPVQQQRRASIVIAALDLAAGGYDAVHIRTVAGRAEVAASTVYQYFSSKDDLLLSCLHYWLTAYTFVAPPIPGGGTAVPYQRLLPLITDVTEGLCAMPRLAEALVRAYLYADGAAAENAALVRQALSQMFTDAIEAKPQTLRDEQVGELLTDVWTANIIAFVQNRVSVDGLLRRLECAVATISLSEHRLVPAALSR
ncbi:TetR/AcrR family transcriptional regulator [Mycolicibacterium komossense]|uniref:TetR family transcriptional regulator n=1 Tax=Mycolicibacterium komossense TaxID=1779 RepID=A0ABT3CJ45_9MYCO|nr:TetR/AcrR family transcriptional regulator [Mycolicibacterium komossense]MCV7229508.1 TetR family transcriptional regulator [Mycolicibacterium komossense]